MMVSELIFLLTFCHLASAVLSTSVVSDPSGPAYQTASLITFTCVVDEYPGQLDSLRYQWYRWCSEINEYTLLQEEVLPELRVLSTPLECWDGVLCNVTRNIDNITSFESGFLSFENRSGVGLSIDGKQVFNSSTVIANSTNSFGPLYCHSAAHTTSTNSSPYWISPSGEIISHSTPQFDIIRSDSKNQTLLYVSLSVKVNSVYTEGLFQCVIHDEHQTAQVLHVWIFGTEFKGTSKLIEHYSYATVGIFEAHCVFQGTPGTIKWYLNESPISELDDSYNIDTHVANLTSLVFVGVLLIDNSSLEFAGDYKCEFEAHFVYEQTGWTTETTLSSFYFIAQPLGKHYDIQCPIADGDNTLVWATRDGEEFIPPRHENQSGLRIEFNPIMDTDHNRLYGCHSNSSKDFHTLAFTIVALVPVSVNALSVSFPTLPIVRSSEQITLQCTSTKTNFGFTETPSIFWISPSGEILENVNGSLTLSISISNNSQITSSVSFTYLKTSDAGHYTCVSFVESQTLQIPLHYRSLEQIVAVRMADPAVSIISNSSLTTPLKLFIASAALFTCKADISSSIDTTFTAHITWYLNGTEFSNETDNVRVVNDSMVSDLVYESQLLVSVVYPAILEDNIGCKVTLLHDPDKDIYLVDSDATTNVPVMLRAPELSVTVSPTQLSVLDKPPYNTFTLTCTVQEPEYLVIKPLVRWTLNGENLTLTNGLHMSESLIGPGKTQNLLKVAQVSVPGSYKYLCEAVLTLPNGEDMVFTSPATVTIKDPAHPYPPTDIAVSAKNSQQATITWLVVMVSYTPETYTVQYGLEEDALVDSPTLSGSDDLDIRYQMYNLTLNGLLANRTYHYRLLAANSHTTIASNIYTFRTPESSITIEILPISPVLAGTEQNLTCLVRLSNSSTDSPMITWLSPDNREIIGNTSERIFQPPLLKDGVTKVTILFPMVWTSQAGLYTCRAAIDSQEMAQAQEYLVVQIPEPTLTDTVSPMIPHGIFIGHDVNMTCAIHLSPFIDTSINISSSWTHNNKEIVPNLPRLSIFNEQTRSSLVISSVSHNFSGEYKCEMMIEDVTHGREAAGAITTEYVILPVIVSSVIQIAIQDLPELNITLNSQGTPTAGNSLNLSCSVTSVDPLMDTLTLRWIGPKGELVNSTFTKLFMDEEFTLDIEFKPLKASDGGTYFCDVTSDLFALGLEKKSHRETILIVSLPPPSLEISLSPSQVSHYAGTTLNLTCRALLIPEIDVPVLIIPDWYKDSMQLPNTTRISTSDSVYLSSHNHASVLVFDTLSGATDSGQYQCLILVLPESVSYIPPSPPVSINSSIIVKAPPLSIALLPSAVTILDVSPYNSFNLTCHIKTDPNVRSPIIFTWKMLKRGAETLANLITDSTIDFNISKHNFNGGVSESYLSGQLYTAGTYVFTCEGFIDIAEDMGPFGHSETTITVKGPAIPLGVRDLTVERGPTVDSVIVYWSVDEIAYTPEEYIIFYGRHRTNLEFQTIPWTSGDKYLDPQNLEYQFLLEKLDIGKQYYYRLVSRNVHGITESKINSFIPGFNSSLFILRMTGVPNCEEWIFLDSAKKIMDVKTGISGVIESRCHCSFMTDQISDAQFICDQTHTSEVVFLGRMYQTLNTSPEVLVRHLTDWASSPSSSLVVTNARLNTKEACVTESINTFNCSSPTMSSVKGGSLSRNLIYIIVGVVGGVLLAVICIVIVICVVWRFYQKAKKSEEESIRMREILRTSSVPLSPIHQDSDEKTHHYMSPKPFPAARYPQTPPPHYMSPRSSVFEKPTSRRHHTPIKERDSHIYYLNTPPRTIPYLPQEVDPVYEPIPGDEGNYQSPKTPTKCLPPEVPKRPPTRKRTASRDSLADKLSVGLSTSRDSIDEVKDQDQQQKADDGCDYIEMNSVDFSSATI